MNVVAHASGTSPHFHWLESMQTEATSNEFSNLNWTAFAFTFRRNYIQACVSVHDGLMISHTKIIMKGSHPNSNLVTDYIVDLDLDLELDIRTTQAAVFMFVADLMSSTVWSRRLTLQATDSG
jgi:hypothetical protein